MSLECRHTRARISTGKLGRTERQQMFERHGQAADLLENRYPRGILIRILAVCLPSQDSETNPPRKKVLTEEKEDLKRHIEKAHLLNTIVHEWHFDPDLSRTLDPGRIQ